VEEKMKPSERYQAYVIGIFGILFVSLTFLPSSLLSRVGDPGDLRFIGWFLLTGLCLGAIGAIKGWADRRKSKWLLMFGVVPLSIVSYEASYILKRIAIGLGRDPATLWTILFLVWVFLTWWLWGERRQYKEEIENWRAAFQQQQPSRCPHCGAHL
jgi:hypothetical protein